MPITIVDYALHNHTYNKYDVLFHSDIIHTMVTHTPSAVEDWLSSLPKNIFNRRYIVGLDVEWLPNRGFIDNPVAVLQLCIDRECLVFQILHASFVPKALVDFLENPNNTFVGVGVQDDVDKLLRDYSLVVSNVVELCTLATQKLGEEMTRVGLQRLALRVLGKDMEKQRRITMSRWNNLKLTAEQVQYACVDAFVSFEIGRVLYSRRI